MTRARRALSILALLLATLAAGLAQAALSFSRTSSAIFFTDTSVSPAVVCNYQSFAVTSSGSAADAWVRAAGFSGGFYLGGNDDGVQHVGAFTPGQTKYAFFYVCSTFTGGTTSASLDVTGYDRNPSLPGAVTLGGPGTFSYTIDNTLIQANPNKVTVIFAGPNPAVIGGLVTMTVEGDTGVIGDAPGPHGPLSFTPASFPTWRADAYELFATNISFTGGNSGSYDNTLAIASIPSDNDTHYVATYYFRAMGGTIGYTQLSPIVDIASGTQVKHTDTKSGAYGSGLLPLAPASNSLLLAKLVSAATLPAQGGTVTYTLRVTNNSSSSAVLLDDFVDTLPPGATYVGNSSTFPGLTNLNPTIQGQTLTWNAPFAIAAGGTADLVFKATLPATPGLYTNSAVAHIGSTVIDTTFSTTDSVPATASTRVLAAPTVAKAFAPVATAVASTSTLTITLTNPNATTALTGAAIADTYPAGLVNAATPAAATTCTNAAITGGTAGGNTIGLTGATIPAAGSCTLSVAVTSSVAAAYNNTTGAVSSINGGTGTTASAAITFTTQPTLAKTFTPASVPLGTLSRVAITVTSNNSLSLTSLAFSDPLPAGLAVAATPNLANTCAGTVTGAVSGSASVALADGAITLPATTCQLAFDVIASAAGSYANTTTGATSDQTKPGAGPPSNTATLTVLAPPAVAKSFGAATVERGQATTLTITLTNPNAVAITGAAFTDNYPSRLDNASSGGATTTCTGGTVTAVAETGTLTLTGGTIPANGSCTVTANVYSSTAGTYINTLAAGAVTTTNAGSSTTPATAQLVVTSAPTIAKSFSTNVTTGITTMTLTITNTAASGGVSALAFTDNFPTGLTVAATPAVANTCGGTVSAAAGSSAISLSGGGIGSAGASCQVSVPVIAAVEGVYSNTTSGVSSSLGTGRPSNTAVYIAPGLEKSFAPDITGVGDVTRMTITISNPSSSTEIGNLTFSDTYPANMTNTGSPSVTNTCSSSGGSITGGGPNGNSIGLSGGKVPPGGTCSVSVNVSASAIGSYYNQTGTIRSSQGVGGYAADTLYVTAKPLITKSFAPATVTVGGTSTLGITVENNNGANAISALAFSDAFPTGLVVAASPALTNTCGGSVSGATAGSGTIALAGGTLGTNARCTITVAVTSATAGAYANQTSGATSTETGATPGPKSNIAVLTVNLPAMTVAKSFAASPVGINTDVAMTITLTNANATPITGVSFTDTYPAGLVNSGTPNLASDCSGASTAAAGSGSLTLAGGTIPASGSCTIAVNVQSPAAGTYINQTGAVTAANANNGTSASATLTVLAPLTIVKSFATANAGPGVPVVATVTLTNPNALAVTGVAFNDAYPAGLANTAAPAGSTTCSAGTVTAAANGTSLALSGGTVPANGSCTVTVNVAAAASGSYTNLLPVGSVTTANAGTNNAAASATLNVLGTLAATKAFSPATIGSGDASLLTITLTNGNASAVTGAAFTDNYPPGLANMSAANGSTTCGGTLTAANGGTSVALVNGTVPANGSCTVTVAVTSATPGTYVNSTGTITSANAGTAPAASGTLRVLAHPTISKAFSVSPINPGGTSTLTVTIANANAAAIAITSVTDTFPSGLIVAATPNIVNGCSGGAVTNTAGSVTLTGGSVAANGSCSFAIDVTSSAGGASLVNTIPAGALASSAGSNTVAASATLDVRPEADLAVTKTAAATVAAGGSVTYTIVVSNAGPQAANGAQLNDALPGVLTGVAASCGSVTGGAACGAVNVSGNTITSAITTLPAGGSVTFTVTATAPAAGTFANTASVVAPAGVFD
ncbi:MAG TPA: hypothetical protein VNU21_23880, partial [Usitatibacter sp.]|nr:hypothetical protein [Usitatibacter sp.]